MTGPDVPVMVPARMLTEYTYCPRLFFLMWVDRLMRDSADVAEGRRRHTRVDKPTGKVPPPGGGEVKLARSVELASEELGIVAKLDLLEAAPGAVGVIPVEFKKGAPPSAGGVWEPDAVQVCAQILLLREHGYDCDHGVVYYATTHQRVPVEPTDELVDKTLATVRAARTTAERLGPPPPLVASPKCPRCSLVGICLPDEVNMLRQRAAAVSPRRLLASKPDSEPVYVTEQGTVVGVSGGRLVITYRGERITTIRLLDVLQLCLYGDVQVTAQALRALLDCGVEVFHFSYGGWLQAVTTGLPGKNVQLRIRQTTAAARADLDAPRRMIAGKIRNCRVLLRRNGGAACAKTVGQLARLADAAEQAVTAAELLGTEGVAARLYFEAFPNLVGHATTLPGPAFTGLRNRRPPTDAVNCLLSFCYALLAKEVMAAAVMVGFDPYIGLFHRPRFGRPALVLDLAEEFRPLAADSTTITLINTRQLGRDDFTVRVGAITLTPAGRKKVIRAWEQRMATELRHPLFGYQVTYRRAMELQARILAAALIGDVPRYDPLTTR